ncbi:unnamed protein product [Pleuronectes platessa]|uniref:Uncharacterized protein n=1 Tax=Pleuronectes platessa TaxID=8262 RepID=A0A9N7UR19_PLEPL|nr:unnamed protein product [Pleuronectes platessa]
MSREEENPPAATSNVSPPEYFTPEAIGFLSAVGVFIVALAVLFLFINKKLCFSRVGGLPCLEEHGRRKKGRQGIRQGLVDSYGDNDGFSSSDSEDEVLKQFEISVSRSQSFRCTAASGIEQPAPLTSQLTLGRRHKFTRLSDQEEGSTEPSDCEVNYLVWLQGALLLSCCFKTSPEGHSDEQLHLSLSLVDCLTPTTRGG